MVRRSFGVTLIELVVGFSLFLGLLWALHTPTRFLLSYPGRVMHQRTDRIAGQNVYNKLYLDLRNSPVDRVWLESTADETLVLMVVTSGFDKTDTEGKQSYILWKYQASKELLSRRRWAKDELDDFGLPVLSGQPGNSDWQSFRQAPLLPEASFVKSFLIIPGANGFQVEYTIKNDAREGKVERYRLEVKS